MIERGWRVHRVELVAGLLNRPLGVEPARLVDVIADVRLFDWPAGTPPPDFVWASPPCMEFSRTAMPWTRARAREPDMRLVFAALGQIATLRPRWWAIENVKGAIPWFMNWLGPPAVCAAPIFLWGRLPPVHPPRRPRKTEISGDRPDLRARIPYEFSLALAEALERAEGRCAA
jgi:hypothetical protein